MTDSEFDDKAFELELKLKEQVKECRKHTQEINNIQNGLLGTEFKIMTENRTTQMLVFDSILELRKNMAKFIKAEEQQSQFMCSQLTSQRYELA